MLGQIARLVTQIPSIEVHRRASGVVEFHKTGSRRNHLIDHDPRSGRGRDAQTRAKDTIGTGIIGLVNLGRNHVCSRHETRPIVICHPQFFCGITHRATRRIFPTRPGRDASSTYWNTIQIKIHPVIDNPVDRYRRSSGCPIISEFLSKIIGDVIVVRRAIEQACI